MAAGEPDRTGTTGTEKRLLVVEDEEALLSTLREELEDAGFAVDVAVTGDEALRKIQEQPPDGVLLDLLFTQGPDGMAVLSRLKQDERTRALPVIILSNVGDDEYVRRALELGADAFFVKTQHSLQDLIARLQVILEGDGAASHD